MGEWILRLSFIIGSYWNYRMTSLLNPRARTFHTLQLCTLNLQLIYHKVTNVAEFIWVSEYCRFLSQTYNILPHGKHFIFGLYWKYRVTYHLNPRARTFHTFQLLRLNLTLIFHKVTNVAEFIWVSEYCHFLSLLAHIEIIGWPPSLTLELGLFILCSCVHWTFN